MIVFEDVCEQDGDGRVVSIALDGAAVSDCQDEQTPAELSAKSFYGFLIDASAQVEDSQGL
jgi:hypothetical protein